MRKHSAAGGRALLRGPHTPVMVYWRGKMICAICHKGKTNKREHLQYPEPEQKEQK